VSLYPELRATRTYLSWTSAVVRPSAENHSLARRHDKLCAAFALSGHTEAYHFHEKMSCLYSFSGGHSPQIGESLAIGAQQTKLPLYGKWEDYSTYSLPALDACGAHFGVTHVYLLSNLPLAPSLLPRACWSKEAPNMYA
jgi:hypothetical protein